MEFLKAIIPWVILVLSGLLYSRQKKRRAEMIARQIRGDPTPVKEPTDNYLFEGLIGGLALGYLASYFELAEFSIAMSFGVVVGFSVGMLIKKKPKDKKEDAE